MGQPGSRSGVYLCRKSLQGHPALQRSPSSLFWDAAASSLGKKDLQPPRAPKGKSRAGSLRRSTAFFNFRWPPRGRKWEDGLGAVLGSLGEVPGEGASSAPGPARPWPRPLHPPAPWSRGASESQCPASIVEPAGRANKAPVE